MRPNRTARWILFAMGVLVVGGAVTVTAVVRHAMYRPHVAGDASSILFTVEAGESFASVKRRLHAEGRVRHPWVVSAFAWATGYDRRVKAGTYRLTAGDRPVDILGRMVAGDVYEVSVTIPEGYMVREISEVLGEATRLDSTDFAALFDDDGVLRRLGVEGPNLEGYLFPDTYAIPWGIDAFQAAATMVRRLEAVFDSAAEARAATIGLNRHQVLTLASIVEAETRLSEELTRVSAVYHNRLRRGMRLEADPTVAYAMGGYKGRLFFRDLEIDSPYNTYRNAGLPPGPICSPGASAIHAALYPDTTCDALYFVARGDGGHVFSRTLSEHLAAVRRVRRASDARRN